MPLKRSLSFTGWICLLFVCSCWESSQNETNVSVHPQTVHQGEVLVLSIKSPNNLFLPNSTTAVLAPGDGLKTGCPDVKSPRAMQISLKVAADAPLGPRILSLNADGILVEKEVTVVPASAGEQGADDEDGPGSPGESASISVSPTLVHRGEHVAFAVTGQGTHFSADTTVSFGPDSGIAVGDVEVQSSEALTFDAEVSMAAAPGTQMLYISGPSGQKVEILSMEIEISALVTCYVDNYEQNNSIDFAVPVDFPSSIAASICEGDHDYFKVNIQEGVTVDFFVQFSHADGDLDIELLTLQGELLASSATQTDNELITFTVPEDASGERVLHVFGNGDAVNNYTFDVDVSGAYECVDDGFEPNDYLAAASEVSFPDAFDAVICSNDDDYFIFTAPGGVTLDIIANFSHSAGDLNLALLSESEEVLASSVTEDDGERLQYTTGDAGNFVVRVYAENGDENAYFLTVGEWDPDTETDTDTDSDTETETETVPPPVCPDIRFSVEPPSLSIGRYTARLTLSSEDSRSEWISQEAAVSLPDEPENVFLEGCTVTTPDRISCNITVGLFAEPQDIRVDVTAEGESPVCGVLTVTGDGIAEASAPSTSLPELNRYTGDIDAAGGDRSDFFHIHPDAQDPWVFHAVSSDRDAMDPILRLIQGNGNEWLFYTDDETPLGIDSRTLYYFLEPADYYVEVGPKFSDTVGDFAFYTYRLTHGRTLYETAAYNDMPESAQMITSSLPVVVHGVIDGATDADVYRVVTDRPTAVDIAARRLAPWDDSLVDAMVVVYDAEYNPIDKNDTWYEVPICADPRVFLENAGTYYIEVAPVGKELSDDGEMHTGFYALNIRDAVVINEIDNRADAEEPFVELLGPPSTDLAGFRLALYDGNGNPQGDANGIALDGTFTDSAGYAVVSNLAATALGETIAPAPGPGAVVLLKDGQGADAVQFGVLGSGAFLGEERPTAVGAGRSIGRGAGIDTNNNDLDFILMGNPTPGAPNDRTFTSPVPLFGEADGCRNFKKDGTETDVDCGGSVCGACVDGARCVESTDCRSGLCESGICAYQETCSDLVQNQDESDVDCGGTSCEACPNGAHCAANTDCQSAYCETGICETLETCDDSILNQDETDVDCGGVCPGCPDNGVCLVDDDCDSINCVGGHCVRLAGSITITSDWGNGYCADMYVTNTSLYDVTDWSASIDTVAFAPYITWNMSLEGDESPYTAVPTEPWNHFVGAGETIPAGGWCVSYTGSNYQPGILWVKGE